MRICVELRFGGGQEQRAAEGGVVAGEQGANPEAATKQKRAALLSQRGS